MDRRTFAEHASAGAANGCAGRRRTSGSPRPAGGRRAGRLRRRHHRRGCRGRAAGGPPRVERALPPLRCCGHGAGNLICTLLRRTRLEKHCVSVGGGGSPSWRGRGRPRGPAPESRRCTVIRWWVLVPAGAAGDRHVHEAPPASGSSTSGRPRSPMLPPRRPEDGAGVVVPPTVREVGHGSGRRSGQPVVGHPPARRDGPRPTVVGNARRARGSAAPPPRTRTQVRVGGRPPARRRAHELPHALGAVVRVADGADVEAVAYQHPPGLRELDGPPRCPRPAW